MARTRNLGNLTDLLTANTGTGIVSANTTPAQFDNSSALATTGFVQQTIGSLGGYVSVSASRSLLVSDIGKGLWIGAASVVLTMPTPTSLGLPPGSAVTVFATSNVGSVVAGSGVTLVGPSSTSGTLNMTIGTSATFVALTGTTWQTINSTAGMGQMAEFGSSFAGSGYQKLPSGMVFQWGALTVPASSIATATFPIAFPTACRGVMISVNDAGTVSNYRYSVSSYTASGCGVANQFSGQSLVFNYLAVGN